jgi:HTH-type transcriptional regulator, transcriptional repressor of NAD biosynthesis genes
MKNGLVLGKFMPFHTGHMALIEFALLHIDHLVVLVCSHDDEPISGQVRFDWLQQQYANHPRIKVQWMEYNPTLLPDSSVASADSSGKWAAWIQQHLPTVNVFISSEPYGVMVAESIGISHCLFDEERKAVPVSASAIRANPFAYWTCLPPVVRPWFVKKICIAGAESTGKSTLTEKLALHYRTVFVPEAGRDIIPDSNTCTVADLYTVAAAHANAIIRKIPAAHQLLFADTDITITRSYARFLFREEMIIEEWIEKANRFDLYLFLETDCPYIQDGTRLSETERAQLNLSHKKAFEEAGISYQIIGGDWQQRFHSAVAIIDQTFFDTSL